MTKNLKHPFLRKLTLLPVLALLVSCGGNFAEPSGSAPALEEYWDPTGVASSTMEKCGMIPASYFDQPSTTGPYRADNIVNWQNN